MGDMQFFQGKHIRCERTADNFAKLYLDHGEASVNKFDLKLLKDLRLAMDAIHKQSKLQGLAILSAKDVFVVGADITEFIEKFKMSDEEMLGWLRDTHKLFNEIEDLPYPTVSAINGVCLGGGFELVLSTAYRVASEKASLGLPETKLGIYPGWGGTIRLPRLAGADNAIEWIAGGGTYTPADALKIGAIDAIVELGKLEDAAIDLLKEASAGRLDWQKRRLRKVSPLTLCSPIEAALVFEGGKGFVAAKAGANYPAPVAAVSAMQKSAAMQRDQAIEVEIKGFVEQAKGSVAVSLVTIFLSDQFNKKKSRDISKDALPVKRAGVLGAGIMGGGIAYQSASRRIPAFMKDIRPEALELGMREASKLFGKLVEIGKMKVSDLPLAVASITPTLSYGDFKACDLVVEAVVENEKIKKSVLAELEQNVREDAIITSNTSTISISRIAEGLKRPENFCGMHFFNPVHKMPLVEVIRGAKSSPKAIATTVAYALSLGKTPVVVGDCPGFLVNRSLFPYLFAFELLLEDGVEFKRIDKVMEKFGWPMGPAYLADVIGIDTCVHAGAVMAAGFPDRMGGRDSGPIAAMYHIKRLGQKSGSGFYSYQMDKKGKPKKADDPKAIELLSSHVKQTIQITDEDIVFRMMAPFLNECVRCLEENIVGTPMELDLAMLYGIGFPPFRGGALKYLDSFGLSKFCEKAKSLSHLSKSYEPCELLVKKAKNGELFYH